MNNLENQEKNTFSSEEEKLKYMQIKIHEAVLECINQYLTLKHKIALQNSINGMNFIFSQNSIADNFDSLARHKSSESVINNITKETLNLLSNLPNNCSKQDIDTAIQETVFKISKDFFGAKLIMGTDNNIRTYCEKSNNENIKQLYKQYSCVKNYLTESKNIKNSSKLKLLLKTIRGYLKKSYNIKSIDISESFIDKSTDKNNLTSLPPLNFAYISTDKDYYTQLVSLLTLLTNVSIPSLGENQYIVGQLDLPYYELVKRVLAMKPKNYDDFIKNFTELAHMYYDTSYEPFDIQLKKAKEQLSKVSKNPRELSSKNKDIYIGNLKHLENNLEQCLNSRLCMAILDEEVPDILNSLSNLPNIKVEIISSNKKAKDNGYCATHYVIKSNNIAVSELQTQTKFYNKLDKEGNCAHNSSITGKSTNIKEFFELNPENTQPFEEGLLDFYCDFLEIVGLNSLSDSKVSKEHLPYLKALQSAVEYASSKIRVKNTMPYGTNASPTREIPIYDYINNVLEYKGAKFYNIFPANRIERNQVLIVPQNSMYSLETLQKSRVGFSALANLIRIKYKEEATIRGEELLADEPTRALSSTLAPKYDFRRINTKLQEDLASYEPLKIPFVPMGSTKHANDKNKKISTSTLNDKNPAPTLPSDDGR